MYTAWLTFEDSFKDVYFPDRQNWNGRVVLRQKETGLEYDIYIDVHVLEGRIYVTPNAPLIWKSGSRKEHEVKGDTVFVMRDTRSKRELTLIIKQCEKEWLSFTKYRLPRRRLLIGRSDRAEIRDTGALMTMEHGYLGMTQDGYVKYQDQSSNGTYLNGRKLRGNTARLNFADVLAFPTGLKIVFLNDVIAVNHTAGSRVSGMEKWGVPKEAPREEDDGREVPNVYREYKRAPRMLKKSEVQDVEIEAPIPKKEENRQPLLLQVGPSMTMVFPMLMGTLVASRGGGGMLSSGLVMIGTSSLLAVMWGFANRNYRHRQETRIEEHRVGMYHSYIQEMEQDLRSMNDREHQRLMETFPNAAQCVALCMKYSQDIWSRMPTHSDFLEIRVGLGEVQLPREIVVPKQKLSIIDDELRNEPDRLKRTYSSVENAPVTVPLRHEAVIGILGGTRAVLFAQGLLMQIATLHSYHDVRIAVLAEESNLSQWAWVRWLPHVFTSEDREMRMVAFTPNDVHDVAQHLEEVLAIRKNNAANYSGRSDDDEVDRDAPPLPHYVIFCTNYQILENELVVRQLVVNRLGMTLVMIGSDMTQLPKECHVVLNVQGNEGYMHSSEGDTQKVDFEYPDRSLIRNFSRSMAPLRVHDVAENAAIPSLVSFLDIYGVRRVEDLEVWRMWTENHTYDGLKSIIGYRAGSQPFVLDISDRFHGPHGLIAGTTGSGKSVMLETYILSMALNYSPRQVQFILIDYKGGGMADAFRDLPHVAGIIDNLQGPRVIDRALASLNGEIHRREKIFKQVGMGINNINDYTRQFGDIPGREMPHLIIIVDEFAELKSEQPEFMGELVSASRVGRSLGIHLILATQKPSNSVSDEIWANSRFHLCLRVQTRQDSMDMLRRPDAAYIKGMGRCFIQIGNDEEFHQVQTSYSKLDYKPDEPRAEEMPQMLTVTGHVVPVKRKEKNPQESVPTQMDAVLGRIYEVAAEHGLSHNRQLWLPAMPKHIYLRDIELFRRTVWNGSAYPNPQGDVRILVGMADDVANQRYLPCVLNLTENRNLLIVGMAGSGKTTMIQSMVYSLCSTYDAEHVNIYILSLTSQTLRNLSEFPQVGDVALDGEVLEVKRFLNMLRETMARRAALFAAASTDSFVEYNNARVRRGEAPEPAIVVFMDRFAQLREMFNNDDAQMALIQTLIQEGSGRGIHFVATAMAKNEIPAKMQTSFGGFALQLKDRSDYSDCVGKIPYDMPLIENITGRGLCRIDGKPYEIQIAMGGAAPEAADAPAASLQNVAEFEITHKLAETAPLTDSDRGDQIVAYASAMSAAWQGARPVEIPRLPQKPTWETLFGAPGFAEVQRKPFTLPVGYDIETGNIATIQTERTPSWMVYGPKRSGVSNFLKLMARVMADRGADVYIIAKEGWEALAKELDAKLCITPESIVEFLQMFITNYAQVRKPLHEAAAKQGRAASIRQAQEFKPCCIIVDNAERLYGEFSKEPYMKHLPQVQGLLGEIVEKPYYNFTIIMGISSQERASCTTQPLQKLVAQGRAIALGGRLNEFDPCGVGGTLNMKQRSEMLPTGQGYVGNKGKAYRLLVPLVEAEDD